MNTDATIHIKFCRWSPAAPDVNSFTVVTSSVNYCNVAVTDYSYIVPIEAFFNHDGVANELLVVE